jgi:hypothetical protein
VPRYEACIQIHSFLNQLACVPYRMHTTAWLKAWTEYQWDGLSIHKEFLRDSEHQVPSASKELCERNLSVIYQHLRDAQEMYNTIHTEKAQVPLPAQPLVRDVVAAAAKQLGVTPQILRQRARPLTQIIYSGSFKSQKRPQSSERGQPLKRVISRHREVGPMSFRSEEAQRNLPHDLNFAAMARAVGLPHLSLSRCIKLAKQSQCFMCKRANHAEGPFSCPRGTGNEDYRSTLNAMYYRRKQLRDDMGKLGIDDALRHHNLQRLWTPPGGSVAAAIPQPQLADPDAGGPAPMDA